MALGGSEMALGGGEMALGGGEMSLGGGKTALGGGKLALDGGKTALGCAPRSDAIMFGSVGGPVDAQHEPQVPRRHNSLSLLNLASESALSPGFQA